ncbi:MAG: serine--tRNA ligase [Alphaproteobacteria bacterium]|nr:serine--tRNA ligase [Alphaproteobacteria bacterium]MBP7758802.1 serine--tRNA ligase [Alphaproteobacteria bacterium]MBP7762124.1 serine--tRNA ligase [Alphaproteobacteria bacterium]MBP7904137.1 serine--tRNA ligase [Alphaproteobacteria bacterium]
MFDLRAIRERPDDFRTGWTRRKVEGDPVGHILKMDEERRSVQTKLQELQATRNAESAKIGKIKKEGGDAQPIMDAVAKIKGEIAALEEQERVQSEEMNAFLSRLPNMLADEVPEGGSDADNQIKDKDKYPWIGKIQPRTGPEHGEIGEKLGLMDFETAAKMSGSRFTLLSGGLARLERALAQFFLDTHTSKEHGYTEVSPPLLVRDNALYGTGQLPKFAEDLFKASAIDQEALLEGFIKWLKKINLSEEYRDENREKNKNEEIYAITYGGTDQSLFNHKRMIETYLNLQEEHRSLHHWLIPTSEVPLTNIVAEMIVDEEYLPRRYTAFTPCFRSEAGASGKDTKGMLRQHQFYKVELVSVTAPEKSVEEHERMTQCAENVLKKLELPFRTMVLCSGDTGFGSRKTYDIEVWLPGQERYREISSCSNCGDFQARRMNARCRPKGTKDTPRFVHTLNGSGVAVGRALIAVIENYYDPADGGVFVPDVLKPYMGGVSKIVKT